MSQQRALFQKITFYLGFLFSWPYVVQQILSYHQRKLHQHWICCPSYPYYGPWLPYYTSYHPLMYSTLKSTHFNAASRAAARISGFWLRRLVISSADTPTIALWNLVVLRARFRDCSSTLIFLLARLQPRVHVNFVGFFRCINKDLHFEEMKTYEVPSRRT